MKQLNLAAVLIFSLVTPLLVPIIAPMRAVAQSNLTVAAFADREWRITVYETSGGDYCYSGYHKRTQKSIALCGVRVSGNPQRRVYTWNNRGTLYQVTWQPRDPNFARILVKTPSGEVLNRVLPRTKYLPSDVPADV